MAYGFRLVLNDKPVLIDVRGMFDEEEANKKELYHRRLTLKSQKDIVSGAESELSDAVIRGSALGSGGCP